MCFGADYGVCYYRGGDFRCVTSYGRVLLCGVHVQSASAAQQDTIVRVHRFLLALPLRPDSCRHPPRSLLVARCSRPFTITHTIVMTWRHRP